MVLLSTSHVKKRPRHIGGVFLSVSLLIDYCTGFVILNTHYTHTHGT